MIEEPGSSASGKSFLKSPVTLAGFAVPLIVHGINGFSYYYEFVPRINLMHHLPLAHGTVTFYLRFDCMWTGLAYLVNTSTTFSLWFFYLLAKAQQVACARLGVLSTEDLDIFSYTFEGATMGMLSHQTMGAMIVMVLLGLWFQVVGYQIQK